MHDLSDDPIAPTQRYRCSPQRAQKRKRGQVRFLTATANAARPSLLIGRCSSHAASFLTTAAAFCFPSFLVFSAFLLWRVFIAAEGRVADSATSRRTPTTMSQWTPQRFTIFRSVTGAILASRRSSITMLRFCDFSCFPPFSPPFPSRSVAPPPAGGVDESSSAVLPLTTGGAIEILGFTRLCPFLILTCVTC